VIVAELVGMHFTEVGLSPNCCEIDATVLHRHSPICQFFIGVGVSDDSSIDVCSPRCTYDKGRTVSSRLGKIA